jgi:hypothetical protein
MVAKWSQGVFWLSAPAGQAQWLSSMLHRGRRIQILVTAKQDCASWPLYLSWDLGRDLQTNYIVLLSLTLAGMLSHWNVTGHICNVVCHISKCELSHK